MKKGEISAKQIEQRQQAALKHGGAAAVNAISDGSQFGGLAADAERAVIAELEEYGSLSLIRRNATRLQAAADLYWAAIQKAAQDGDLSALDHYVSRYGWLAGASLRAWTQLKQEERQHEEPIDYQELLKPYRKAEDGNTD